MSPVKLTKLARMSSGRVTAAFLISGTVHLVRPAVFEPVVPRWLPRPREIVYVSGVAELVCAGGLLAGAPWARKASAVLLLGVWPGNLQMALDATAQARADDRRPRDLAFATAAWARMPLQIPMIRAVLSTGHPRSGPTKG
ncbi:DoxX family protein [Frankia sp. CcI49]|uniref:DoxX family protein n=1 Tax=unclassified Frankia TaxID=2632575 RepID=UPI0006C9E77B|nr:MULTISPECIES: DoxX family protein [unclassified Frankia]KPM53564.1 DoxX family protein [Frankia sp. R43]ONH52101.1 DoxX family protein [Frankia sp. CcI49]